MSDTYTLDPQVTRALPNSTVAKKATEFLIDEGHVFALRPLRHNFWLVTLEEARTAQQLDRHLAALARLLGPTLFQGFDLGTCCANCGDPVGRDALQEDLCVDCYEEVRRERG
jgi:hypothetical protein